MYEQIVNQFRIDSDRKSGGASFEQTTTSPEEPTSLKPVRNGVVDRVAGRVGGLGAALALGYFDDSVPAHGGFEQHSGRPVLAFLSRPTHNIC